MDSRRIVSLLMAVLPMSASTAYAFTCPLSIDAERSLVIRDLSVVEDPVRTVWTGATATTSDGAWSFGRLMTNMAGANNPSDFVRRWLGNWEKTRTINHFTVQARPKIRGLVINPWPKLPGRRLDLTKAPFRLLAIVFRIDLRDLSEGRAGEGRFVFGVLDEGGRDLQFTVILEYFLPASTEADVLDWAGDFADLSALPFGSDFNAALEAITNRFTDSGVAPGRINGSAIGQVHANEIALAHPWQLRMFKLIANGTTLKSTSVKQTPDISHNNSTILSDWIDANTPAILASRGSIEIPRKFNGVRFRAGAITNELATEWDSAAADREAMFRVAVNTCNGCHGAETGTQFLMIETRDTGAASDLAEFFTGIDVADPRDGTPSRTFNELDFRIADLDALLCPPAPVTRLVSPGAPDAFGRGITGDRAKGPSIDLTH